MEFEPRQYRPLKLHRKEGGRDSLALKTMRQGTQGHLKSKFMGTVRSEPNILPEEAKQIGDLEQDMETSQAGLDYKSLRRVLS